MENNLIDLAKLIFEGEPKSDYSIHLELENYNSLEDLFEVLLHVFVYGYKIKELDVSTIHKLIPYFRSIGVNFHDGLEGAPSIKLIHHHCRTSGLASRNRAWA